MKVSKLIEIINLIDGLIALPLDTILKKLTGKS